MGHPVLRLFVAYLCPVLTVGKEGCYHPALFLPIIPMQKESCFKLNKFAVVAEFIYILISHCKYCEMYFLKVSFIKVV